MERNSTRQLLLIGVLYTMDATLMSVPAQVVAVAKQDAWLSYLPAFALTAVAMWLVGRVHARFPGQDLYQSMVSSYPVLGRLFALGYVLFFFICLSRDLRMISDFTHIVLLNRTPLLVIAATAGLCAIAGARAGVEVLGRMTELFGPTLLAAILFIPLFVLKDIDIRNFEPVLAHGLVGPLQGAWYLTGYLGETMAVALIAARRSSRVPIVLYALAIGTGALLLLTAAGIGAVGTSIMERSLYPSHELVRVVRITDFLDRLDLIYVGIWMPTMILKISYGLYVVCHGLHRILPGLSAKLSATPVGLFAVVCSGWFFANTVQTVQVNRTWPAFALIFILFIPAILFVILRPRRAAPS